MDRLKDTCDIYCYDEEKVQTLRHVLQQTDTPRLSDIFKALSDETRTKIACALLQQDELCVCDVAHIIGTSMATASHHLRFLRKRGIAKFRRQGKLVFYSLDDEPIRVLLRTALTHVREGGENVGTSSAG